MLFENGRFTPFMWMHMFFMRFAIDIVFLGRGDMVIRINRRLKPWRVSSVVFGARRALELPGGRVGREFDAGGRSDCVRSRRIAIAISNEIADALTFRAPATYLVVDSDAYHHD